MSLSAQSRPGLRACARSIRPADSVRVEQYDFDRGQKNRLGRLFLSGHPAAQLFFGHLEMLRQRLNAPEDQACAMQPASIGARVLGRRKGAVLSGSGHLSHKRYRATLSAHTQVAIIERMLSFFGHRRVE
jgi:hypothetical protein